MKKYLKEVEKKLKDNRKENPFVVSVYNTQSIVLAVPVPIQRKIAIEGFSFSGKDFTELKKIWKFIWDNSNMLEVRSQSIYFYESKKNNKNFIDYFCELKKFVEGLDNWAHSDTLSDLFSRLLERDFEKISPTLSKWNKSNNSWKRRQSIVSLFYYQKMRIKKPPLDYVLEMVSPLLKDKDHYVQKGVGWTLREAIQVYPKEVGKFLDQFVNDLSPIAFTTVCEKISKEKVGQYKLIRKDFRSNKALRLAR
jgi:3-methyladenine DNA glycosylase AlkD